MKLINPETKTFKVFSALQSGKALTASQASKLGVKNLSAEVSRIRQHGFDLLRHLKLGKQVFGLMFMRIGPLKLVLLLATFCGTQGCMHQDALDTRHWLLGQKALGLKGVEGDDAIIVCQRSGKREIGTFCVKRCPVARRQQPVVVRRRRGNVKRMRAVSRDDVEIATAGPGD